MDLEKERELRGYVFLLIDIYTENERDQALGVQSNKYAKDQGFRKRESGRGLGFDRGRERLKIKGLRI